MKKYREYGSVDEAFECIKIQRILGNDELADKIERELLSYIQAEIEDGPYS